MGIKLNLGASPIWKKEGWYVLDHKLDRTEGNRIAGDATAMDLVDGSCDVVFCSHVFEHIPHTKLPLVLSEINRVLKSGGTLRLLTPDLKKIAKAYIDNDEEFFLEAKEEDPSLRTDLGFGGMMMNFIVSPGQDTILVDRNVNGFIAGYAHIYSYDFDMLKVMLNKLGYKNIQVLEWNKLMLDCGKEIALHEGCDIKYIQDNFFSNKDILNTELFISVNSVNSSLNKNYNRQIEIFKTIYRRLLYS